METHFGDGESRFAQLRVAARSRSAVRCENRSRVRPTAHAWEHTLRLRAALPYMFRRLAPVSILPLGLEGDRCVDLDEKLPALDATGTLETARLGTVLYMAMSGAALVVSIRI